MHEVPGEWLQGSPCLDKNRLVHENVRSNGKSSTQALFLGPQSSAKKLNSFL